MATTADVANAINNALLSLLQHYEPISEFTGTVALEENPVFLELSAHQVYNNLQHLNKFKAWGPDGLPNWVLKEYAVLLAQPVSDILNASYKEQKLPCLPVWKLADITPLPKVKQVSDPKKELRPISLTPALSKITEDFIVSDYIKPALEEKVAPNQFGTADSTQRSSSILLCVHLDYACPLFHHALPK